MTRLTNEMRSKIIDALVIHTFNARVGELCDERAEIANTIYDLHYKRDRKRMNELPEGWLRNDAWVKFESSGRVYNYAFNGRMYDGYSDRTSLQLVKIPANLERRDCSRRFKSDEHGQVLEQFNVQHDVAVKVEKHVAVCVSLSEQIVASRNQAAASINRFTTVEKLIEGWPEIKPFIPETVAPVLLPAVPVDHLNRMFDLPVGDPS